MSWFCRNDPVGSVTLDEYILGIKDNSNIVTNFFGSSWGREERVSTFYVERTWKGVMYNVTKYSRSG